METARRRGGMRSYGRVPTVKEFVMEVGTRWDIFFWFNYSLFKIH